MARLRTENIRRVMDVKGWKQSDLAREMGYSPAQISRVLRGIQNPGGEFIMRLTAILPGFSNDEFFLPEVLPTGNSQSVNTDRQAAHA